MVTVASLIVGVIISLVIGVGLPAAAIFLTPNAIPSVIEIFTDAGWTRFLDYFIRGENWDRWLIIACAVLALLFFITGFFGSFIRRHPALAFLSLFGLAIFFFGAFFYAAWPNPEEFALWHRVLFYIQFCYMPFSLLGLASRGFQH